MGQSRRSRFCTMKRMADVALDRFIGMNRDEIVRRCRAKVSGRSNPPATQAELDRGVPLFLDQLVEELTHGPTATEAINRAAVQHGRDLLFQGFTVGQVVHDYGDVCQSVTDLAVEQGAPIGATDFRTLNRCLDDAIAGAVTEFGRQQDVERAGESHELKTLADTALTAFEVLQEGSVGVAGSTGALVHRTLVAIRALAGRPLHPES
jgi:hypothetical protein